jgi:hypothetical protein
VVHAPRLSCVDEGSNDIFHIPKLVAYAPRNGGQRLMDAAEVAKHEVQRQCMTAIVGSSLRRRQSNVYIPLPAGFFLLGKILRRLTEEPVLRARRCVYGRVPTID